MTKSVIKPIKCSNTAVNAVPDIHFSLSFGNDKDMRNVSSGQDTTAPMI
ncbi:MAG: hypothetical protein R2774_02150 [Saprospiraceae bacterium]